jgi:hypothetical protein
MSAAQVLRHSADVNVSDTTSKIRIVINRVIADSLESSTYVTYAGNISDLGQWL